MHDGALFFRQRFHCPAEQFVRVEMVCRPFLCRVVRFVAEHTEFLLFRPPAAESVVTEVADADHDESLQIRTAVQRTAAFP